MSLQTLNDYRQIWLVDFEFHQPDGERPAPICMVAVEYHTGRVLRVWSDELITMASAPFPTGDDTLFVAYYASSELNCFLVLGWPLPTRILDLFVEFRNQTNGLPVPCGNGLLGALAYFGLEATCVSEKESMRQLAMRGGPYTAAERQALLQYCESDVLALVRLLPKMADALDLSRSLLRGRFMAAAARVEWAGIPLDVQMLQRLKSSWPAIQQRLITEIDRDYGVYQGRTFKIKKFELWLLRNDLAWPYLDSGTPDLSDETFRQLSRQYPIVAPLRELRHTLSQMRLCDLAVGQDGRCRCLLSAFRARTGRNQPSNSRFPFGPSCWLRGLIRPAKGRAIAYLDYEQQEFAIAAALSSDAAMKAAYISDDPYLTFAKQAGAVPESATKSSHPIERNQFKICSLAVLYGMSARSLSQSLGVPEARGRELLQLHHQTYPAFWQWSQAAVDRAMLLSRLHTVFGWQIRVDADSNPRSIANFPVQGNGAEVLRLACCLATERGITVCAPVHDALLVESPVDEIDATVTATREAMVEASRVVLDGFTVRADAKIVRWPERYMDDRGLGMWKTVMRILEDLPNTGVP